MTQPKTVLITGASGKFGRHTADAFASAGWTIRRFDRARDDLREAARGVDAIVMGMHPPSYDLWAAQFLPLHEQVIAAALAEDVPVVLAANVYGFGAGSAPDLDEASPQRAGNPLGLLRRRMEALYRESGVRTIMLVCGDFIDDRASGNWFDRFIAPKVWKGRLSYPGALDAPHAWCWLPDAARIAVMLTERAETLERFTVVTDPGLTLTARDLGAALAPVVGQPVTVRRMAWWPLWLLRPVMPVLGGVFEMRYLWSMPHRLGGGALKRLLPDYRPTPQAEILRRAVAPLA
ncbi:hypothetical protein ATO6_04745 [Oceanicola sp. 22II-s10i]|uniref:epimerase n=1 Tax=Oceanicola sp. 22II-s10i TaxID=1317116 RepID=UPI000B52737A|nr:epimerase [Oceanicola sp. 22II-s10i]OWU86164.1 hypothetical protein ATO6_04745 [Oceanicola sp. 22II-s10i]